MTSLESKRLRGKIAAVVCEQATQLANVFAASTELFPRWMELAAVDAEHRDEYVQREFGVLSVYLEKYFRDNDDAFLALFVGERLKAFYEPSLRADTRRDVVQRIITLEKTGIIGCLQLHLPRQALDLISTVLDRIHGQLLPTADRPLKVLFFGDCLFLDIGGFLVSRLLEEGISIEVTYLTVREIGEVKTKLRALGRQKFDLVFYSPFTYEFYPEYQRIFSVGNSFLGRQQVETLVLSLMKNVDATTSLLAESLECPIFVHNAAGLLREEAAWKRAVKMLLTRRTRISVARWCNQMLDAALERINRATFKHVYVLDEARVVSDVGEFAAGAFFHKSELQHPALMGRFLAPLYAHLIYSHVRLVGKKLIVCDLDNTLWDGVIGEGTVKHLHDRQAVLRRLRQRGVVLAILSKNDPANVHWEGGLLSAGDFVYSSVSWDPKVQGMKRIETALNMKSKDFVFIDDRADERALMHETFPKVLCLDATDADAWRRLSMWSDLLDDETESDRTLMYKQREERINFTGTEEGEATVDPQLFLNLQLKLRIAPASRENLKRVVELINRTNQFNLEGTRTTYREVSDWYASSRHVILIGTSADRFGDMGITCVAVMGARGEGAHLLAFVLSCRVFGYGIERAMLNELKRVASQRRWGELTGRYKPTALNMPCADFLRDNGFSQANESWTCDPTAQLPTEAEWLQVTRSA